MTKILITGGAGFVGTSLGVCFREKFPHAKIVALDNLKRRGSELNLPQLRKHKIEFQHGDIRHANDLADLNENFDLFIEASAEPSVLAGMKSSAAYAIQTNLFGTFNCLEFATQHCGAFLFLSTSRVYSIPELLKIPLTANASRFQLKEPIDQAGLSANGIAEKFSTQDYRSLYGTTKLASEMLIQEYAHAYHLKALINRCSVIAGPGQMGKVDQGVFTLWLARHLYKGSLQYTGFGGNGLQVRDLLHPHDLFRLILLQLEKINEWNAQTYNVGGGLENSVSLCELTGLCQDITSNVITINKQPESSSVDIPWFITDYKQAATRFQWKPEVSVKNLLIETKQWLTTNQKELEPIFGY